MCCRAAELVAQGLIDACVRLLPGVASNELLAEESFASGLLKIPITPGLGVLEGLTIPEILLSGDHKKIAEWRREQAEKLTEQRRPICGGAFVTATLIEVRAAARRPVLM